MICHNREDRSDCYNGGGRKRLYSLIGLDEVNQEGVASGRYSLGLHKLPLKTIDTRQYNDCQYCITCRFLAATD